MRDKYGASEFRRTLRYITSRLGDVPVTRLQKLVYLIDLEHFLEHGETLTGAPWVRQKYGPMTKALLPSLDDMVGYELELRRLQRRPGRAMKLVAEGPAPRYDADLTQDQQEIVDEVLEQTRAMSDDDVRRLAYSTTPMRYIEQLESQLGRQLLDKPIVFRAMADPAKLQVRDAQADYASHAEFKADETRAYAPWRDRALSAIE